jgi:hypothetical protein
MASVSIMLVLAAAILVDFVPAGSTEATSPRLIPSNRTRRLVGDFLDRISETRNIERILCPTTI